LALVALSVVEQRYRAVMAVLDGARVSEVAVEMGVSRQVVHAWLARYRLRGWRVWRTVRIGRAAVRIRPRAELNWRDGRCPAGGIEARVDVDRPVVSPASYTASKR
jgi:excisionase family DNA binding protein